MGPQVQIVWVKAYQKGDGRGAKGNNWADAMAKLGAAEHEIDKAVVKEAKLLKVKDREVARWIGAAAVASFRMGVVPSLQPMEEWPARTPEERGILSRERSGVEPAETVEPPGPDEEICSGVSTCGGSGSRQLGGKGDEKAERQGSGRYGGLRDSPGPNKQHEAPRD